MTLNALLSAYGNGLCWQRAVNMPLSNEGVGVYLDGPGFPTCTVENQCLCFWAVFLSYTAREK